MAQFSEKELQLMAAMVKNFNGSIAASVDWHQAAIDAGYKDSKNAKVMWTRLEKKIAGGATTNPATASKKRKAADSPQAESSSAKVGRSAKKPKTKEPQLSAGNEVVAVKVKIEGHASEVEDSIEQEGEEEDA